MLSKILAMKWYNVFEIDEIDKCVSSIAFVLEINGEVEEINLAGTVSVIGEFSKKHLLCVLVWNISHHQRRARVLARLYCINIQCQVSVILVVTGRQCLVAPQRRTTKVWVATIRIRPTWNGPATS